MRLKRVQRTLWVGILPSLKIEEAAELSLLAKMASQSSEISPSDALFVTSGLKVQECHLENEITHFTFKFPPHQHTRFSFSPQLKVVSQNSFKSNKS
ncbi:hypothetical protein TNIN_111061 [Trichonephila inaurata madagascariensis]|uniref:Uncharacterized protein n=1 Tax=Trichonephila inaurata madagascariensis TaxID=2747483 RepID=A0A8X6XCF4_9ARAC|nr:hypothetical protein TNIN_111061 [Trichonephila inaurata madagascariensis]